MARRVPDRPCHDGSTSPPIEHDPDGDEHAAEQRGLSRLTGSRMVAPDPLIAPAASYCPPVFLLADAVQPQTVNRRKRVRIKRAMRRMKRRRKQATAAASQCWVVRLLSLLAMGYSTHQM